MFYEDDQFVRGKVPMTKRDIRALILSRFFPLRGGNFLDIGAGTGAVSVTAASLFSRVFAVERNKDALELIRQNCRKFGVNNLTLLEGEAPELLMELPLMEAIFIGGSGGFLESIVEKGARCLEPRGRMVLTAITLETLEAGRIFLNRGGLALKDITQAAITRLESLGGKRIFQGNNPVFILTAEKVEEA